VSSCKNGQPQPTEEPPCGVNPLTETTPGANGEGFARESGKNRYTIRVKNAGGETAGASYRVGETLQCVGAPVGVVTLAYRWLRGGQEIAAASASTYVIVAADEGHPIQCEVTRTGTEAASAVVTNAVVVGTVTHALPKGAARIQPLVKGVG